MKHEMKLKPKYYNYMLNGTKRIELRLYDEKRQKIKLGDTIKFLNDSDISESFETRVVELIRYDSFNNLFRDFDVSIMADKSMTKKELLDVLEEFYNEEEQKEYGVLGIRVELTK